VWITQFILYTIREFDFCIVKIETVVENSRNPQKKVDKSDINCSIFFTIRKNCSGFH